MIYEELEGFLTEMISGLKEHANRQMNSIQELERKVRKIQKKDNRNNEKISNMFEKVNNMKDTYSKETNFEEENENVKI